MERTHSQGFFNRAASSSAPQPPAPAGRDDHKHAPEDTERVVIHIRPEQEPTPQGPASSLAARGSQQLHPPVSGAIAIFERVVHSARLTTATEVGAFIAWLAGTCSLIALAVKWSDNPDSTRDWPLAVGIGIAAYTAYPVIYGCAKAVDACYLRWAQAREASLELTPSELLKSIVTNANQGTLTEKALTRCVANIRELGRRHPQQISGPDMARALAALAQTAVFTTSSTPCGDSRPRSELCSGMNCLLWALSDLLKQSLIRPDDFVESVLTIARHARAIPGIKTQELDSTALECIALALRQHNQVELLPLMIKTSIEAAFVLLDRQDARRKHTLTSLTFQVGSADVPRRSDDSIFEILESMRPMPPQLALEEALRSLHDWRAPDYIGFARKFVNSTAMPLSQATLRLILKEFSEATRTAALLKLIIGNYQAPCPARLLIEDELVLSGMPRATARQYVGLHPNAVIKCPPDQRARKLRHVLLVIADPMERARFVVDCMESGLGWHEGSHRTGVLPRADLEELIQGLARQAASSVNADRAEIIAELIRANQLADNPDLLRLTARILRALPELQPPAGGDRKASGDQPFALSSTGLRLQKCLLRACTSPGHLLESAGVEPGTLVHPDWLTESLWDEITSTQPLPHEPPVPSIDEQEAQLYADAWRTRSEHKGLTEAEEAALAERLVNLHTTAAPHAGRTIATSRST